MTETMKAMGVTQNGFEQFEIAKPIPLSNEVRVKVIASSINPGEEKVISGEITGRFLHAKTSPLVLGWDFAGTVEAKGDKVNDLNIDQPVWGHLAFSPFQKQGAFAEYITIPRKAIAVKPDKVPFHVAAASATVSMTALQSLKDIGRLSKGDKALIIGAGGGIGAVAVSIGIRLNAKVTAVCGTKDVERTKALGANKVIDRTKSDPLALNNDFDLVFDTPNAYSFSQCQKILKTGGCYITTLPDWSLIKGLVHSLFSSKHCSFVKVASKRADLELVSDWLNNGFDITIDSRFKITDLADAIKRQQDRSRMGRVVVDVADAW